MSDARTDTKVILYSVQCYALHWTDNNLHIRPNVTDSDTGYNFVDSA